RPRRRGRRRRRHLMLEPLYTTDEMKAAEAGHDVRTLMERAGRAVADEVLRRYPEGRTFALYAGKGANGGDGKIAARILEDSGADIGLERRETEHALVTAEILRLVPVKRDPVDKSSTGSVLVVGGARGTTGAAALAARAAFRADAGYVAIAAPADALPTLETLVVEAVKRPLETVFEAAQRATALALGPGLGRDQAVLVKRLLEETELPAVVDADALYELRPFERAAPTVLTPHSGELARLLGEESKWV